MAGVSLLSPELASFRSVAVIGTHPKTVATGSPTSTQMTVSAKAPMKNLISTGVPRRSRRAGS
jgi:hypothetical protein